ncbi:MAG TPA: hypothetical protein PK191_04540 [Niabella sp.]|nr:hypothetical protein [Niabella sp.]HQX20848.1 hypothetical protein [Niabella sp.]HRB36327.1 hypothetical protein [Niabella sp.]HRB43459.1 hypothetical protein [Niabella sp.]HRB49525.1 hypothetical protein [Niabella sp.]
MSKTKDHKNLKAIHNKNSATPGISDIIGFHRKTGQFIAFEIIVGKDNLSNEQEIFLKHMNRAGGIGIEVRKIEDLEMVHYGSLLKSNLKKRKK